MDEKNEREPGLKICDFTDTLLSLEPHAVAALGGRSRHRRLVGIVQVENYIPM